MGDLRCQACLIDLSNLISPLQLLEEEVWRKQRAEGRTTYEPFETRKLFEECEWFVVSACLSSRTAEQGNQPKEKKGQKQGIKDCELIPTSVCASVRLHACMIIDV